MARSRIYCELRDALSLPGCPLCRVEREATERYVDSLLYEKVNDPGVREAMRTSRGFCPQHAWLRDRHGASLGVAILTRDVLRTMVRGMRHRPSHYATDSRNGWASSALGRSRRPLVVKALEPEGPCPVCALVAETQELAAREL